MNITRLLSSTTRKKLINSPTLRMHSWIRLHPSISSRISMHSLLIYY